MCVQIKRAIHDLFGLLFYLYKLDATWIYNMLLVKSMCSSVYVKMSLCRYQFRTRGVVSLVINYAFSVSVNNSTPFFFVNHTSMRVLAW